MTDAPQSEEQMTGMPELITPPRGDLAAPPLDDKWLENFYKECGRELTLANGTLNLLKNWAAAVVAVSLPALIALGRRDTTVGQTHEQPEVLVYIGALVVYIFSLRFFIRAILAYVNMIRWNNLQAAILKVKLLDPGPGPEAPLRRAQLEDELRGKIRDLYFGWNAPSGIGRLSQLASNLKLGFALVLALPLLIAGMSVTRTVLTNPASRGVTVFAIGYTLLELLDFAWSPFFDTPEVQRARRRSDNKIFPTPITGGKYLLLLLALVLAGAVAAAWPTLYAFLRARLS
jgi:hypothetical protein